MENLKEQFESKTVGCYEVDLWKRTKSGEIIGTLINKKGVEIGIDWDKDGKCIQGGNYYLIPIKPEPIKLKGFVNVYASGYRTIEDANRNASASRIAVIDLSKIGEEAIIR